MKWEGSASGDAGDPRGRGWPSSVIWVETRSSGCLVPHGNPGEDFVKLVLRASLHFLQEI